MTNDFLLRDEAPISAETWSLIDMAVLGTARSVLSGRKLLDIEGPFGYSRKSIALQDSINENGISTGKNLPFSVVRHGFCLGKRDIASYENEKLPLDMSAVVEAALRCSTGEDRLVFSGTDISPGLMELDGSSRSSLTSWSTVGKAADDLIKAVTVLDEAGYHGPYSLALTPARYNLLLRRYAQGGTELDHVQTIVGDRIIKAPAIESGGVLIAQGTHFASILIGQDIKTGYVGPGLDTLEFYVSESLALLVRRPDSICVLG